MAKYAEPQSRQAAQRRQAVAVASTAMCCLRLSAAASRGDRHGGGEAFIPLLPSCTSASSSSAPRPRQDEVSHLPWTAAALDSSRGLPGSAERCRRRSKPQTPGLSRTTLAAMGFVAGSSTLRLRRNRLRLASRLRAGSGANSSSSSKQVSAIEAEDDASWAELQKEAASLRAEAEQLEEEQAKDREKKQREIFKLFDKDGNGKVDAQELRSGLKEYSKERIDASMASRLLEVHDENEDGVLTPNEFDLFKFEATLNRLKKEARAKEEAFKKEELKKKEQEMERQQLEDYLESLPAPNQDDGFPARLASCAAYILPFLDGFKFAIPLVAQFSALQTPYLALLPLLDLWHDFPFTGILLFIVYQFASDNTALPTLLRFNLRQAVLLDIIVGLLTIVETTFSSIADGEVPVDLMEAISFNGVVFGLLCALIGYCCVLSLFGITPCELPWVSEYALRTMAPTRPADPEAESREAMEAALADIARRQEEKQKLQQAEHEKQKLQQAEPQSADSDKSNKE
eukprot:TRINITY_DN11890_c0_g1_i1.p1 TRINITY_DN11890_c0_g1~~TRINITY_DN11890_c0_g1_i1.p1  ORF type:complete len:515 (-),score=124.69 TRINITY_DN11890_c0_g1_i1:405-1949(-)